MKTLLVTMLMLMGTTAYSQTCDTAKTDLDKAVAAVKLACVNKSVSIPTPVPSPTPTAPSPTPAPVSWSKCADEGGRCNYTGTRQVRYGVAGKWNMKTALGSIGCNNEVFGDPVVGTAKICEVSSVTTTAPSPTPAPTNPTPAPTTPPSTGSGIFIGSVEYGDLAAAGAAVKNGETIKITKSLVDQATALTSVDTVTVECTPGVHLEWKSGVNKRLAWGKGVFNIEGATKNFTIKNCEISGAQIAHSQGGNGAAVRLLNEVDTATFENVNFHHSNNGILGGAKVTKVINSRFSHNGWGPDQDGHTHNIYISEFCNELTVKNSYFGPVFMGNVLKSRCKANNISNSQFESKGDINSSYLLDLPNGGKSVVVGNVFVKAPNQGQRSILSWTTEGKHAVSTYEFAHNLVINDGSANFIQGSGEFNFHDNTVVGPAPSNMPVMKDTKTYANRSEAGLAAAPALPAAPGTGIMTFFKGLF